MRLAALLIGGLALNGILAGEARPNDVDTVEKSGLAISYRLSYSTSAQFRGYQLTLTFQERAGVERQIAPRILVLNASGAPISPASSEKLETQAALLTSAPIPQIPPPPPTYHHSGTVNLPSGGTASYSGTSTPQMSFEEARARREARQARQQALKDRDDAAAMTNWLATWLKPNYVLQPKGTAIGWLLYSDKSSPEKLIVEIAGDRYEFDGLTMRR